MVSWFSPKKINVFPCYRESEPTPFLALPLWWKDKEMRLGHSIVLVKWNRLSAPYCINSEREQGCRGQDNL